MGDLVLLQDMLLLYQLKKSLVFQLLKQQGYGESELKRMTLAEMRGLATESWASPRDSGELL